jgi:hypothetical protein
MCKYMMVAQQARDAASVIRAMGDGKAVVVGKSGDAITHSLTVTFTITKSALADAYAQSERTQCRTRAFKGYGGTVFDFGNCS